MVDRYVSSPFLLPKPAVQVYTPSVASAHTDAGDRGAPETDERVHILNDDAEAGEDRRNGRAVRALGGRAALERPGGAPRGGRALGRGGGGGKDCEGGDGEEFCEHDESGLDAEYYWVCWVLERLLVSAVRVRSSG